MVGSKFLKAVFCWTAIAAGTAIAQSSVNLTCQVTALRQGDQVVVRIFLSALQPTRADYKLTALKIDAAETIATDTVGSTALDVGRPVRINVAQYPLQPDGWLEFRLAVKERLTGTDCKSSEIVSPM